MSHEEARQFVLELEWFLLYGSYLILKIVWWYFAAALNSFACVTINFPLHALRWSIALATP